MDKVPEMRDDTHPEQTVGNNAAQGAAVQPALEESIPDQPDSSGASLCAAELAHPRHGTGEKFRLAGVLPRLRRALPTVLVLGTLAGLGYFGHHHGWKIPKFSELTGDDSAGGVLWCEEHGVPEAECISCNADLMPKGKLHGWCPEHGVAECVFEYPELAQVTGKPDISQADLDRAARALALRQRRQNDPTCKLHLRRIQFANVEAVEKAGIDIRLVERGAIVESITANAEVMYDPTRVARLASRAPGAVWRVEKNVGDHVGEGEVLALVDSVDVGRAKADLLQAIAQVELASKTFNRLANLEGVVAGRRLQEAETEKIKAEVAVERAIQALLNLGLPITLDQIRNKTRQQVARQMQVLGLPDELSDRLDPGHTTGSLVPVVAPRAGIVVQRDVVAGEVVDTTRELFTVVDTSQMWLMLDVHMEDAEFVAIGQKIAFRPDGSNHSHTGSVTWTSTEMDPKTRTVKVRAELPNRDGYLLNESFGAARIILREEADAIVVPKDAVHWEGCCHVVFVRDRDFLKEHSYKVFHTRMVRPGVTNGDYTEMIAGVVPGEVVVTSGSGVLRAELLKGNLGAG